MFFDLLFRVGPAIKTIFELGYEPKEELFYELTCEQYCQLEKENHDITKKWFTVIPKNPKLDVPELLIVDENGKAALIDAVSYINKVCEKATLEKPLLSFEEKLKYMASILPGVFSQSSKYEKYYKASCLKIVK